MHAAIAVDESRDKDSAPSTVSFVKLMGASLLVGAAAAVLCAVAWWVARWLEL